MISKGDLVFIPEDTIYTTLQGKIKQIFSTDKVTFGVVLSFKTNSLVEVFNLTNGQHVQSDINSIYVVEEDEYYARTKNYQ